MSDMDGNCAEPTIGERIRRLRRAALMTQDDLAAAASVSTDLIRKLEQGQRHTASIGSLHRIAAALDVDLGALLGRARPQRSTADDGQALVLPIRDALTPIDDLTGLIDGGDVPTVAELGRSVTYGWGAYWGGHYSLLAAMLPDLLAQSRAVLRGAVADHARAIDRAAQVQQLTAGTLLRLGAADLAHTAARESLRLAAGGDDPLRDAAMRSTLTYVLIRQGRFSDAERVAAATAVQIQPAGNASAANELLTEATAVAGRTGVDRTDYEVVFGPSNVVMQSADVAVVTEDYAAAAEVARRMPPDSVLPMEQSASDWTAHHRLPRMLVGELLTRRRPSSRLRELAQRLQVTPGTTTLAHHDE